MFDKLINLFHEYMGTGIIVILFLAAIIYLFLNEKKKEARIAFVYVPVITLVLFFNPLFARLVYRVLEDEIYYRVLWLLPVSMVLAYTAADLYAKLKMKRRLIFALGAMLLVVASGSFIYSNPFFHRAENIYHVPQSVVDICDAIEVEGREVMAVFPIEMLQYVRQYSPTVCMPYGREMTVERWFNENELMEVLESEHPSASELSTLARNQGCIYIVFSAEKVVDGKLEEHGYEKFAEIDGYVIYKDSMATL